MTMTMTMHRRCLPAEGACRGARRRDLRVALERRPIGFPIDQEQLARLHKNYLESGLDFRDDESEMKKLDPDWEFKPIRW